jgi:hypothetical protein
MRRSSCSFLDSFSIAASSGFPPFLASAQIDVPKSTSQIQGPQIDVPKSTSQIRGPHIGIPKFR